MVSITNYSNNVQPTLNKSIEVFTNALTVLSDDEFPDEYKKPLLDGLLTLFDKKCAFCTQFGHDQNHCWLKSELKSFCN